MSLRVGSFDIGGRVLLAGALALMMFLGATAYSAMGSSHDVTWYACRDTRSGVLSNVTANSVPICGLRSEVISWSQTGPEGPPGPQGDPGEDGEDGEQGPPGVANPSYNVSSTTIVSGGSGFALVGCPNGSIPMGGGHRFTNVDAQPNGSEQFTLNRSEPVARNGLIDPVITQPNAAFTNANLGDYGWWVSVRRISGSDSVQLQAFVMCAEFEMADNGN